MNWQDEIIGKKIQKVEASQEDDKFIITFMDGKARHFRTVGDCCSSSWIEHLEVPNEIEGSIIISVDEPELNPWDNHVCDKEVYHRKCGHDSLAVYHTRIRTDRGDIVLEYRNNSNGYYGGWLEDDGEVDAT